MTQIHIRRMHWWIGILMLFPHVLLAQTAQMRQQVYPEKLHRDIDALGELIQQAHPDPFRYQSSSEFQQVLAQVKDSVRVPQDMQRFMESILPIFHAVGDARCIPEPPAAYSKHLLDKIPLLPLKVRILEDGVYVEEELKGFRSMPNGSRIVSINGNEISAVIEKLCTVIVADGANITYKLRRIERELHLLYAMHIERASSFKLRFIPPGGEEQEGTVFAMTGEEILRSRKPPGASLLPWAAVWEPKSDAMWVTMSTMSSDHLALAGQRPEKFLDAMLSELKENKVHTLVIDLRGAGGADAEIAELVFGAIAAEPYRLLEGSTESTVEPSNRQGLSISQVEYYSLLSGLSLIPGTIRETLAKDDPSLLKEPMAKAFRGKVYVVCDGYTRDAAAAFVMLAKRSGRALTFGEETGTNAHSYTGGRMLLVTLPNSGLQVQIPLVLNLPGGTAAGPLDRGEFPHHKLLQEPRDLAAGQDAVKLSLLRLIRELR